MIIIDDCFSPDTMMLLSHMVGKKLDDYAHDPFLFSTAVYGIVGITVNGSAYAITNQAEPKDYFGSIEDVACLRLKEVSAGEIHSFITGNQMIVTPVGKKIIAIDVVNETQKLFQNQVQTYEVKLTRGIIFHFEDTTELSFEKNVWFSEDISVEKGYEVIGRFTPTEEFTENWEDEFSGVCERNLITIKDS